jgi:hypothetical protein
VHHLKTLRYTTFPNLQSFLTGGSPLEATTVLESYLTTRLAGSEEEVWTEDTVITLIWLMTSIPCDEIQRTTVQKFADCLDKVHQVYGKILSPDTAHGAVAVRLDAPRRSSLTPIQLFWKPIESSVHQGKIERTLEWCRLALHALFANAGDANIGKIERRAQASHWYQNQELNRARKIVKCHMDLSNFAGAHDALQRMSPCGKKHPLSRSMRYSLALRRGDTEEGRLFRLEAAILADKDAVRSALASLASADDERNRLLFGAVSEAMQYGSNSETAQLLQWILDKYKNTLPSIADTFALLR